MSHAGETDSRSPSYPCPPVADRPDFGKQPLTRSEYITALAHLYRGEMSRALNWRGRLDTTTNWAVISTLAILSFSFQNPAYSQEMLIAGMYANLVFLVHEARRFRVFDLFRSRVRMIEENLYGPLLRRNLGSPIEDWGDFLADDLLRPRFKISLPQALRARILRNYIYVFAILLLAWVGRLGMLLPERRGSLTGALAIGDFPWWMPAGAVVLLYAGLAGLILLTPRVESPDASYSKHRAPPGEDVSSLDV